MQKSFDTLVVNRPTPSVCVITLNRSEAANALNTQLGQALADCLTDSVNDAQCRAILLAGAGKHFCAGADLKERKGMNEAQWQAQHDAFEAASHAILHAPIPVLAVVQGAAYGGGLELALACDFIYAADTARFALTEATLGIMPGLGGTQRLARRIGEARAREYLLTGKAMNAAEACSLGLVNAVFPPEKLMEESLRCANAIAANAPLAIRAIRQSLLQSLSLPLPQAMEEELVLYKQLLSSKDRHEGINAFNEKRRADFRGE